jgi:hypothetical protein
MADAVVSRADDHGPGPIMQAIIRSDTSDEIRIAALHRITKRLVDPLVGDMVTHDVDRPALRAQIAVSALLGVSLARSLGWFNEMRSVPKDELASLIAEALHDLIREIPPLNGDPEILTGPDMTPASPWTSRGRPVEDSST